MLRDIVYDTWKLNFADWKDGDAPMLEDEDEPQCGFDDHHCNVQIYTPIGCNLEWKAL